MTHAALWMRHGLCDDGHNRPAAHARSDSPLTATGTAGAEETALDLHRGCRPPTLITSSPLPRARQTAIIVADVLACRLANPDYAFAEWRAPQCVLGLAPAQYPPEYRAWREQRAHDPLSALPGGESLGAFAERAAEAAATADDLATRHDVLIVSHRLLIGAIAAQHDGHRHPADIFGYASQFRLAPAQLWTAQPGERT